LKFPVRDCDGAKDYRGPSSAKSALLRMTALGLIPAVKPRSFTVEYASSRYRPAEFQRL
jgi:hypothetical protein